MRIVTYKAYVDEDQHTFLVKERSTNFTAVNNLSNPSKVCEVMRDVFHLHELAEEEIYLICINSNTSPTGFFQIGKGTVNSCLVDTRDIFIRALLSSAVKIILCHNHPTWDPTPSEHDINVTKKIQAAGNFIGIPLADHIIIGGDNYFSFAESNLL